MSTSQYVSSKFPEISREQWADLLRKLKEARMAVQLDSEAFQTAFTYLEHLGRSLAGESKNGFGGYKDLLLCLIGKCEKNERLICRITQVRNDHIHQGTSIRHEVGRLVSLILKIEDEIMRYLTEVSEIMAPNPTVANHWNTLREVRQWLLTYSYSAIPYKTQNGVWTLLTETNLEMALRGKSKTQRTSLLDMPIRKAHENQSIEFYPAEIIHQGLLITDITGPITAPRLVFDEDRLVGILTAYDLL